MQKRNKGSFCFIPDLQTLNGMIIRMNDLTIELRQDGGKHLYEQIYDYIKQEIRKGKLLHGEKLPSTRFLSEFLQVSRSTVELSYEQLVSEGYIEARPYRGYFVCKVEELFELEELEGTTQNRNEAGRKIPYRNESYDSEENCNLSAGNKEAEIDFSPNTIDMSAFPYSTWKKITKNILVDANSEMFTSGSPKGDYELRKTIGRYLHSSRGVNCRPEQIIIGAGNDYLLMLLEKILGRHVKIAMENPTYKRAYRIFDSFAYQIKPVAMDEKGMSAKELRESGAEAAYVMPSHQYPTGIVMPIGRRMELLKWAGEKEGRYLIEDDYDSEFRFKGKPVPSLQASDRMEKVIYIGTFSKSIAPAIRIGYMVLPLPLLQVYEQKCSFYSTTVSRIDQRILNEFIKNGHFERHLNRMRKIYREKHDLLLEELKGMEKEFTISGENAGLHLLLRSRRGVSEKELVRSAALAGVRIYDLTSFCVGELPKVWEANTVILGYASLSREQITEGVLRLKKAWKLL